MVFVLSSARAIGFPQLGNPSGRNLPVQAYAQ
jgi:hypothetical protein